MEIKEVSHEESRKIQLEEFEPMTTSWKVTIEIEDRENLEKAKNRAREMVREELAIDVREMKKQKKRALERRKEDSELEEV